MICCFIGMHFLDLVGREFSTSVCLGFFALAAQVVSKGIHPNFSQGQSI